MTIIFGASLCCKEGSAFLCVCCGEDVKEYKFTSLLVSEFKFMNSATKQQIWQNTKLSSKKILMLLPVHKGCHEKR